MDPRFVDVLHDSTHVHVFSIRDRVDVVLHRLVDQDRGLGIRGDAGSEVQVQIFVVVDDLHPPSAQDVRGPHDYGIAELAGYLFGFFGAPGGPEAGVRDAELGEEASEAGTVLGEVYRVRGGAEDLDAGLLELARQLQRALAAELEYHAGGMLAPDDLEDVLGGQGLEVKPRRGIVVGRDGLGVGVN